MKCLFRALECMGCGVGMKAMWGGRARIQRCLESAHEEEGPAVVEAVSLMERASTIRALPMVTSKSGSQELLHVASSCSPVRVGFGATKVLVILPTHALKTCYSLRDLLRCLFAHFF